jgi:hypothetical protein
MDSLLSAHTIAKPQFSQTHQAPRNIPRATAVKKQVGKPSKLVNDMPKTKVLVKESKPEERKKEESSSDSSEDDEPAAAEPKPTPPVEPHDKLIESTKNIKRNMLGTASSLSDIY